MISENWERWEPLPSLCTKYSLEKIIEEGEVSIVLSGHKNETSRILLKISRLFAYTVTKNSFDDKLFNDLQEKYGPEFHTTWTFFKVNNSDFIKWIDQESSTIASSWAREEKPMQHFCLITMEEVIDIMVYGEPKITRL